MNRSINVLGLAGTVQTGKSELQGLFERCGWRFLDLNDPQCDLRAKGTSRHEMFMSRFPGVLKDCGSKTGEFYDMVTPEFYHERVAEDLELVIEPVLKWCREVEGAHIILSWEYIQRIASHLQLDHVLLLTPDEAVWRKRLRARLRSRGAQGDITDTRIDSILTLLDVWPNDIRQEVEIALPGRFTTFDVSDEDWGASKLPDILARMR